MTNLGAGTRTRRGAHRARREPGRVLGAALIAVAVVVAAAYLGGAVGGSSAPADPGSADSGAAGQIRAAEAAPGSVPDGHLDGSSGAREGPALPPPQADGGDASASQPSPDPGPLYADVDLIVLNSTRITGLARAVAQRLERGGWTVAKTGNYRGTVDATTIYYPRGERQAALAVAEDLAGSQRVRPRFGNLSQERLTVVVTEADQRRG